MGKCCSLRRVGFYVLTPSRQFGSVLKNARPDWSKDNLQVLIVLADFGEENVCLFEDIALFFVLLLAVEVLDPKVLGLGSIHAKRIPTFF
jgi:hypothetical protein